jgi:hypothetical protein
MALLRNGANVLAGTNRYFGAVGAAGLRGQFDIRGAHYSFQSGEHKVADVTNRTGWPNGYRAPAAWQLPQKGGAITSRNECALTITVTGVGAKGLPGSGTATITLDATALGGLIAGGVASATVTIGASGDVLATLGAPGSAEISIAGSAVMGALGWLVSEAVVTIDGELVSYGIGRMDGTTAEAGLSPTGIANAVWAKIIEAGFSADEVLRLLVAHAAGDATGLEGAATEFLSLDGTKTRIAGGVAAGDRTITARDASE